MPDAVKINNINELGWGKGKTIAAGGGVIVSVCLLAWGILIATGHTRFCIKGHEIILFPVKFKEHAWLVSRTSIILGTFGVGMGVIVGSVVAFNRRELRKALEAATRDEFFWQEPEKGASTHLKVGTKVYRISVNDAGYQAINISDHKDSLKEAQAVELRATAAVKNRATHVLKEKARTAQELVMQGPEMIRVLEEKIHEAQETVTYAIETKRLTKKAIDYKQAIDELNQRVVELEALRQELQLTREQIEAAQMEIGLLREEHPSIAAEIRAEKAKEARAKVEAAHSAVVIAFAQKEQAEKNLRILQEKQSKIGIESSWALQELRNSNEVQSLERKAEELRKQLEPLEQEIRQIEATVLSLQNEAQQVKNACAADDISVQKFQELTTRHINLQLKVSAEEAKLLLVQRAAEKISNELDAVKSQMEAIFLLFHQQEREKLEQARQQVLQAESTLFEKEQAFAAAKVTLEKAQAVDPESIAKKELARLRAALVPAQERAGHVRQEVTAIQQADVAANSGAKAVQLRLEEAIAARGVAQDEATKALEEVQHLKAKLEGPFATQKKQQQILVKLRTAIDTQSSNPSEKQSREVQRLRQKYTDSLVTKQQIQTLLQQAQQRAEQAASAHQQKAKTAALANKELQQARALLLKNNGQLQLQLQRSQDNLARAELEVARLEEAQRAILAQLEN